MSTDSTQNLIGSQRKWTNSSTSTDGSRCSIKSNSSIPIVYHTRSYTVEVQSPEQAKELEDREDVVVAQAPGHGLQTDISVNVGDEEDPILARIATVDLSHLGWRVWRHRLMGRISTVFVLA